MKKSLALLIIAALMMTVCLTGCGAEKTAPAQAADPGAEAAPESTPESAPTPTPAPKSITVCGRQFREDTDAMDLYDCGDVDIDELIGALPQFPNMRYISLPDSLDYTLSFDKMEAIHNAAPKAAIDYDFNLYGKSFNLCDGELDLKYIQIQDEGELVRRVMDCMVNLGFVDMDSCGVSNEAMAALRDDHPNVEVVWRIKIGNLYSMRTNVEMVLASAPELYGELIHDNVMDLKYCTKVKYLDLGHNNMMDTIEFVRYMPDLEVAVLAMIDVDDFSALACCPKLEYLELFTTRLHDLTPLSNLTNLRHLNICYNFAISDISPLYNLTQLERLWIGYYDPVPPEQIAEMHRRAPNCQIETEVRDPTDGEWRIKGGDELGNPTYHPRYELLREQFGGYTEWAYSYYENDPLHYYGLICP